MRRLLITKKRGGLWVRLAAFMVVLMMTTAQVNAQTVQVDGSSTYTPTNIINGKFDTRPFEAYKYNGNVYNTWPGGSPNNVNWSEVYPNGINGGWNSSETMILGGSLFEYLTDTKWHGNIWHNGPIVEMNAVNSAVLSQDLATRGGDVILWTIKHAARPNCGGSTQSMRVEIGAPMMNGTNIVRADGINSNINSRIVPSTLATYRRYGVTNPNGVTYGYGKSSELAGLEVYQSYGTGQDAWKDARGVYVIPANQSVTRFAFIAESTENPDCGNLLDDITFSTLIGNLQASVSDVGDVIIKGYWGDADANKRLCVKVGTTVHQINMSGVLNKNFKITFPRTMIGSNTQVDIYHQDYEQAKVRLQFAIKVCTVGTGQSMIYYSSVNEAISKATNGQTVNMIADATENVTVGNGKNITLNLNGQTLTAKTTSGAVITNNGTLTLTDAVGGGKVTGGAKGVQQNGTLTVGGKLNITGNTTNLYLPTGKNVAVSSLASGANIGVTTQTTPAAGSPVAITSNGSSADAKYFKSDNTNYKAIYDGGKVKLSVMEECYTWAEVRSNLENGKNVKLMADITQDYYAIATLGGTQNVTLDLNGHTLTQGVNHETATWIINCPSGSPKVTIKDSGIGGAIVGNPSQPTSAGSGGGGFHFLGSSSLTLESGTLRNFRLTKSDLNGGCIFLGESASFTMNGGAISNCTSNLDAGAIYNNGTGAITINGGTIENCTATGKGGAVYSTNGNITVGGTAKITGNTVGGTANNVYLPTNKTITVSTTTSLASGANIGVTTQTAPTAGSPVAVTTNGSLDDIAKFHSDNTEYSVICENGDNSTPVLKLAIPVCMVGEGENAVYYSSVGKALEHIEAGETATIKLLENTTENIVITDENITLNLNGKTITATSGDAITVSGGTLTINDPGDTGGVTGNIAINGGETTINNGNFNGAVTKSGTATINVTGGKYSADPTPFLDTEHAAMKIEGQDPYGYEVVGGEGNIACTAGGHGFFTLQQAIDFQTPPATVPMEITMSKDINECLEIADGKDIILDLKGKTITSNGGGTVITNNGTLTVIDSSAEKSGKITGAEGENYGISNNGTLNLNAGNITGNANGVKQNGIMTVGGTTKIEGNTSTNLYLPSGKTVAASSEPALEEGASIHVTTEAVVSVNNPVNITSNGTLDDMKKFHSDNGGYSVICENDDNSTPVLKLAIPVCVVGEGEDAISYSSISKAVEHAEGATTVKMTQNSNENLTIATGKDIILDLKGKTITSANGGTVITNNGTLTVIDSSDGNGIITGATTGAGIGNTGTLKLYAGWVTSNATGVDDNGKLTLGGKADISLNGPADARKDLYMHDGKVFSIGTGTYAPTTMHIGITTQTAPTAGNDITLSGGNGEDYSGYFFSDVEVYSVFNDEGGVLKLTNDVKVFVEATPIDGGEVQLLVTETGMPVEDPEHILYGTAVTITATPSGDYAFAGWYDKDSGMLFSKIPTCTFDAIRDYNLEARFTDQVIWVKVKKGN